MNSLSQLVPTLLRLGLGCSSSSSASMASWLPADTTVSPEAGCSSRRSGPPLHVPAHQSTELVAGALLLSGRFVPLALVLLARWW